MSLILDALNRADNERKSEQSAPNLQAAPIFEEAPAKPYLRWLIEGLFISLLIGYVLYLQVFKQEVSIERGNKQIVVTTPDSRLRGNDGAVDSHSDTNSRQATPAVIPSTDTPAPSTVIPAQAGISKTPNNLTPAISQLYKKSSAAKTGTRNPQSVPTNTKQKPSIAVAPPTNTDKQTDTHSSTPRLTELSFKVQKDIPTIDYNQHVYLDQGLSFVEINDQILKSGASINRQLRLISIHPDFSILSYQGTRFKLNALNSWVNFNQ